MNSFFLKAPAEQTARYLLFMKDYSIVVIGAGAAGLVVAIGCARAGKSVLLIERENWGGDCTNFGCIPSKTLIGDAAHHKDGTKALQHVRDIVKHVRSHEEPESLNQLGVDTLTASASFIDPHLIEARNGAGEVHRIKAKNFVIATGSSPKIPSITGLAQTPFLTNETVFHLPSPPKTLIVLGGGPIGCELAQSFQRLGSSVKLIHKHAALLNREPKEASDILIEAFKNESMELYMEAKPTSVTYDSGFFRMSLDSGQEVVGEQLLISVGREPSLKTLDLDKANVQFDDKGIKVDDYGRTSQKHIFAVGDAIGPPFFTHLAENRARAILTTLLLAPFWKKKFDTAQAIPRVTYTDPEIASIGISEEDADLKFGGNKIAIYKVPMSQVDRAITQSRTEGFIKIITKRWSSKILGATVVCPRAGEVLCEISLAMFANIPLRKLAGLIHPYPTYSLAVRKSADQWLTGTILPFARKRWKK